MNESEGEWECQRKDSKLHHSLRNKVTESETHRKGRLTLLKSPNQVGQWRPRDKARCIKTENVEFMERKGI